MTKGAAALTLKNFSQKNLPFYREMRDNRVKPKTFFSQPIKERRFYHEERIKNTRKKAKERLGQLKLACELAKLICHYFPDLEGM